MVDRRILRAFLLLSVFALVAPFAFAQQTGSISGKVTSVDGQGLPGVTVEATSTALPQPRTTITTEGGEFRLPALQPGSYTLTFSLAGLETRTRTVQVVLSQEATANVTLGMSGVSETVTVTAEQTMVNPNTTAIESSLSDEVLEQLPMRQEYRDLLKLVPAVQYSEDAIRGPSAGGSGQDNVYQFDGVNVSLPLYGNLSAEPSSHDIEQVSIVRGGAKAVDFNRAGGFTIDTVSKSGTSEFMGQVTYQVQNHSFSADERNGGSQFEEDKTWGTLNLGGPLLRDRLFFYGSYYRPTISRENRSNLYGDVPEYGNTRDEVFGKLTYTPTSNILLNGSYRHSDREVEGTGVTDATRAGTASQGEESRFRMGILEGSWVINNRSVASAKFTNFINETLSRPDNVVDVGLSVTPGARLDINNLDQMGLFVVPRPLAGQTAFNEFIAPIIQRYGYVENGTRVGGGRVGVDSTFSADDFYRDSAQLGYDLTIGSTVSNDIHIGLQWYRDAEELVRTSNGWGRIEVPGGRVNFNGQPVFYQAIFEQQSLSESVPAIRGEFESRNLEINDTIKWNDFSFNVGVMLSQDTLYGQGLREDPSTLSGYVRAPGNKYVMHEVDWQDQIQPRLGTTWAYNGVDTVYVSYAKYNPAVTSLPRAASWDRNLSREITANFDQNGVLMGVTPLVGSSGKLFEEGIKPRYTDEYLLGTSQQINNRWTARAYARHRYSANFWEDTNNNARVAFAPPEGVPRDLYIPNLADQIAQIGGPNATYVIAELDGAFTKYYEVTAESDWRSGNMFVRGSYTWSHYYGNFDQDNTTTVNDASSFVGSSFIGDGAGRQIWNNRYGDLRGDRRHMLKVYGFYSLPWNASVGAFSVYQSGQPWEAWNVEVYRNLTTSLDDTARYAEPAGSRRTDAHYQLDFNYTQNIPIRGYNFQLAADMFNVFDKQTGYNIQNKVNTAAFGTPRSFYDPRRFQLAMRFQF